MKRKKPPAVLSPELINLLQRRPELWGVGVSEMAHVVIGS